MAPSKSKTLLELMSVLEEELGGQLWIDFNPKVP